MSWKRLSEASRTIGLRLTAWHAAIFVTGALLLFGLIYYLLGNAIDRKDQEIIDARLREYVAVYENGGVSALRDWIFRVHEARKQKAFFVRLARPAQTVLLMVLPEDWIEEDLAKLETNGQLRLERWIRVPRDAEVDLTVASTSLADGTFIQVGRSSDSRQRLLEKFQRVFLLVMFPALLLGIAGGTLLTGRMTQPLRRIADAVRAIIDTGRMDVRIAKPDADDELADLVVLFNRMLEGNEALVRALRESLDNVAHDLRTPLARLRAILEDSFRREADPAATHEALADALEESDRVQTIIRTLMDVAHAEAGLMRLDLQPADLGSLVDDVIGLYEDVAREKGVALRNEMPELPAIEVDPARMRQVFANLLDNAVKYTPSGGTITIIGERGPAELVITFRDTGIGIAEADLPRIWERLFRGDKSRSEHGLGLGLSLVKAIVEVHRGRVTVTSRVGEGSAFSIHLPFASPRPSRAA